MFSTLQAKVITGLIGLVLLGLACLASYSYGRDVGVQAERVVWQDREIQRTINTATTAIAHTATVVKQVEADNTIERKSNGDYEAAMAELRASRARNDYLVRLNGGLRISADACTRPGDSATGTEAPGTGLKHGTLAGTIALPQPVEQDLRDSADEADDILERYRALRQWTIDHGFLEPVPPTS